MKNSFVTGRWLQAFRHKSFVFGSALTVAVLGDAHTGTGCEQSGRAWHRLTVTLLDAMVAL